MWQGSFGAGARGADARFGLRLHGGMPASSVALQGLFAGNDPDRVGSAGHAVRSIDPARHRRLQRVERRACRRCDRGSREVPRCSYQPDSGTRSGFLYERIREDFQVVLAEWVATEPIGNVDAPATPFEMDSYVMPGAIEAEVQRALADERAVEARTANQNGDNYVLTTVLFASVIFFAGVSTKLASKRNRVILLGVGVAILIAATVTVLTFPIEI